MNSFFSDRVRMTYGKTVFVNGNFLNEISTANAHFFLSQQMMYYDIRQVFPFKKTKMNKLVFSCVDVDKYLKAYRSLYSPWTVLKTNWWQPTEPSSLPTA